MLTNDYRTDTSDEMCNFYFMYYTDNNPSADSFGACSHPADDNLEFPEQDDYQCPDIVPPIAWQRKEGSLSVDQKWMLNNVVGSEALPLLGMVLGQVTAVQARSGHVYVLHRGVVRWDLQLVICYPAWKCYSIFLQIFQQIKSLHGHSCRPNTAVNSSRVEQHWSFDLTVGKGHV